MRDEGGVWQDTPRGIEDTILKYFQNIFGSQGEHPTVIRHVTEAISLNVLRDTNADLIKSVTEDEVKGAVFQMHFSKAPGPDCLSPLFHQKFWHTVGRDVVIVV